MSRVCHELKEVIDELRRRGICFVLVHESAMMGWGTDSNGTLSAVDVLLKEGSFDTLSCIEPTSLGEFSETKVGATSVRLWSRKSLGITEPFSVTSCNQYECDALAPESVLAKLPYSPDSGLLAEQRARLAASVYANDLSDDEVRLLARYVRSL